VRKLVDETIDLLRLSGHRKTLLFKAATGSVEDSNGFASDTQTQAATPESRRLG